MRTVTARAPTRLDFGGGWTDVPPYPDREGGTVCNIAITRYATATVSIDGVGAQANSSRGVDDRLVRAALRRSLVPNVTASISSDFPVGAGLGGSSAACVALAGALATIADSPMEPVALAACSRATEVEELGVPGGYQDHYAAAFGGALLLTFSHRVAVERIALTPEFGEVLARRIVVVYTGESRISGDTIIAVRDAYLAGEKRVVTALARMKLLAREMAAALRAEDLDALGALVGEHWTQQRALHASITTPGIEVIVEQAQRAGALGVKALGASGGGCVLAIAAEGREEELTKCLGGLGERLTFAIDRTGFEVISRLEEQ
jgi:D-glycero-alpha-D-manno-heptose-7-phosphate kinase